MTENSHDAPRLGTSVGILATGMYVPPEVRRNDSWPSDVVARWMEQRRARPIPPIPENLGEGARRVLRANAEHAGDPFQGTVERRVLAPDMTIFDMEERAARDAIARSRIDPMEIDLLLTHTVVPDHQMANPACALHEQLGLSATCLSMHTEATAYSVLGQLALAEASIASGRARYALLVQSCAATRLIEMDDPSSVLLGDGATAVVLGPVSPGRGFLSAVHYTEGRYPQSLIMSVPGGRWFDDGRARVHIGDPRQLYEAHLRIPDTCAESVLAALKRAGHELTDVDFLCVFQGTPWLQRVVYEQLGLRDLEPLDIFHRFGYLSSAMIPAALYVAEHEGKLADGDLVVMTGGGTGMTYGAAVLRWGT
jgi:3-oxoacyl-[acyl-carrier-protein] synthase-3